MQCQTMLYITIYWHDNNITILQYILLRILQYKQKFIQDGGQEPIYINKTILFLENPRCQPFTRNNHYTIINYYVMCTSYPSPRPQSNIALIIIITIIIRTVSKPLNKEQD